MVDNLTLINALHAATLTFYHLDRGAFRTAEDEADAKKVIQILMRYYPHKETEHKILNEDTFKEIKSARLKERLQEVLKTQGSNCKQLSWQNTESLTKPERPNKLISRFVQHFASKTSGSHPGSIGFKRILNEARPDKYLNLWLIKHTPGINEVTQAQIIRAQEQNGGKERQLIDQKSFQVASKIFDNFINFSEFHSILRNLEYKHYSLLDRVKNDIKKYPVSEDGKLAGRPVKGLKLCLQLMLQHGCRDPSLDNIGFVDKGDYFQVVLVDFELYAETVLEEKSNIEPLPQNVLKTALDDIFPPLAILYKKEGNAPQPLLLNNIETELPSLNYWEWPAVINMLNAYQQPLNNPQRQILAEWLQESLSVAVAFPRQLAELAKELINNPLLNQLSTQDGKSLAQLAQKLIKTDEKESRAALVNQFVALKIVIS